MPEAYVKPLLEVWRHSRRRHVLTIEGSSMTPLLRPGDRVTVLWTEPSDLRPGDIIAYWNGTRVVVHRLLEINLAADRTMLRESGDQGGVSRWIHAGHLLGRVDSVIKSRRTLVLGQRRWRLLGRLLVPLLKVETRFRQGDTPGMTSGLPAGSHRPAVRWLGRSAAIARRMMRRTLGGRL